MSPTQFCEPRLAGHRLAWCGFFCLLAVWLCLAVPAVTVAQSPPESNPDASQIQGFAAAVAIEKAVVQVIASRENSVVAIGMFRSNADPLVARGFNATHAPPKLDDIPDAFATGIIVDKSGLILTCAHAIKADTIAFVRFAKSPVWWHASIHASDPYSDMAVLKIEKSKELVEAVNPQPMLLGDASNLKKGQLAITLGNPYAIARDGEVSAGWGIVSNLRRKSPPLRAERHQIRKNPRPTIHHLGTLIQTDAKLNLGTSGGALLNLKGEMVGLTTSMAALSGYEKSAGYAIAVDKIFRRVLEELKAGREVEYGFLGVSLEDLPTQRRLEGRLKGASIVGVMPGGPAAGKLHQHDIITHVDGQPILSVMDMMLAVSQHPPETPIEFRIVRSSDFDSGPRTTTVRVTKKFIEGKRVVTQLPPAWRGIRVEYPTAVHQPLFSNRPIENGVIVTEVPPDKKAVDGLELGSRITHVEGIAVTSPVHFLSLVKKRPGFVRLQTAGASLELEIPSVEISSDK